MMIDDDGGCVDVGILVEAGTRSRDHMAVFAPLTEVKYSVRSTELPLMSTN